MRVTVVSETYHPQVNGVSRTLRELVRHMRSRGDSVQVIHPDYGIPSGDPDEVLVPSWQLPFYKELHLPYPPFGPFHRSIERFGPDIIHIATEATLGADTLRFALSREIPVVSSFHTNFDQYSGHYGVGWARGTIWRYLRWFHNMTRETYVPSRTTIRELESKGFERLVLWPRGVNSGFFRPDRPGRADIRDRFGWGPDEVVVGYVSRIAPEKNVEYLAESLGMAAKARPKIRALLVGDGPSRQALESRLGSFAKFVGYQTGESLADHYAACDLFAFSSLTETFGNVVLEAMSSGLPVVAIRSGGVAEIVRHDVNGILVDPDRPPSVFVESLISLVDRNDARREMCLSARQYATSQSWDTIMGALRDRYASVIEAANPISSESRPDLPIRPFTTSPDIIHLGSEDSKGP